MNYLKIYEDIITYAKNQNRFKGDGFYYENHHIYPSSWCKESSLGYLIKDKRNLVLLAAREHFIAHILLAKEFGGYMWSAIVLMSSKSKLHKEFYNNSRFYEIAKIKQAKVMSDRIITETTRDKSRGKNNHRYGKIPYNKGKKGVVSIETRRKMSDSSKGNPAWNKGKKSSKEQNIKNSLAKSKGWYITPHGCFISISVASNCINIPESTIYWRSINNKNGYSFHRGYM